MSQVTEISILSEQWNSIRKNPQQFVEDAFKVSTDVHHYHGDKISSGATVKPVHDTQEMQVYLSFNAQFVEAYPESLHGKTATVENIAKYKEHLDKLKSIRGYLELCEKQTQNYLDVLSK